MAGIDKIYLDSYKEVMKFYEWAEMFDEFCIKETNVSLLDCFYEKHYEYIPGKIEYCVTNTPCSVDKWLLNHCPLQFVRCHLYDRFGYKDKNLNDYEFYINRNFDRDNFRLERTLQSLKDEIIQLEKDIDISSKRVLVNYLFNRRNKIKVLKRKNKKTVNRLIKTIKVFEIELKWWRKQLREYRKKLSYTKSVYDKIKNGKCQYLFINKRGVYDLNYNIY